MPSHRRSSSSPKRRHVSHRDVTDVYFGKGRIWEARFLASHHPTQSSRREALRCLFVRKIYGRNTFSHACVGVCLSGLKRKRRSNPAKTVDMFASQIHAFETNRKRSCGWWEEKKLCSNRKKTMRKNHRSIAFDKTSSSTSTRQICQRGFFLPHMNHLGQTVFLTLPLSLSLSLCLSFQVRSRPESKEIMRILPGSFCQPIPGHFRGVRLETHVLK